MPAPFVVQIARRFAANLCLRSGPMTALDLALFLGVLSETLDSLQDPDGDMASHVLGWLMSPDDTAIVWVEARTLLRATGLRSHGQLERPFERLEMTTVSLGLRKAAERSLWGGWEVGPADRYAPRERGLVSARLLDWASPHGQPWPVHVDLTALARFKCRHSAIVYLRALSWLAGAGTARSWQRTPPGPRVTLTVPIEDLPRALGTSQLAGMGAWNAKAFGTAGRGGPVHEDLESAGLRLRTRWVMAGTGLRTVPVALEITVSKAGARKAQAASSIASSSSSSPPTP